MPGQKVLLVELNEITWDLIDPLVERGKLPTFARLKREGAWGTTVSVDEPPHLDPWITWTTVYSGRPQDDHKVQFLQQPPESIRARRLWEICHEAGLGVGVYGSLCSWPPKPVDGFYVPDTFAPDTQTHPESLEPIQELNLTYTRSIRLPKDHNGPLDMALLGAKLLALGLSPSTCARIARQLAAERRDPSVRWRRVALQPIVNFDFFSRLYRRHRPSFATFHSNHVAHYMHTYWRMMEPDAFPQGATEAEIRTYGGAIEHGYETADELLGRVLGLVDRETTVVVASSMGQKPYLSEMRDGKPIMQVKSLDRLLEILGLEGRARAISTMSDQFNIYADTPEVHAEALEALESAYVDAPDRPMFFVQSVDKSLTVNLIFHEGVSEHSTCYFPTTSSEGVAFVDLVHDTGLVKSGCHDPRGILMMHGKGIAPGARIDACSTLDLAPTMLTMLGLPVPAEMRGRVLEQAFAASSARVAVAAG
jgi:hypothetical protein